jgi:lipopolysaccharide heptosyltransferase III
MLPKKILVVVTQRIGDVLLSTPLIRSMRRAWPQARLEVLVFSGTEGVLQGNPDVDRVISVPLRMPLGRHLRLLAGLWRKYDLALSLMAGDRPTLYAFVAGRQSLGLLLEGSKHKWKQSLLSQWIPCDDAVHTVLLNLRLAERLGVEPCFEVVASWQPEDEAQLQLLPFEPSARYIVLHVYPMYAYKMWRLEAWAELARWIESQGLRVVLTGGAAPDETTYIQHLLPMLPDDTVNLAGKLNLGGVACLLSHAQAYVGPDTAVTHLAAASGIPVVALFGPSNPVKWGPWPQGYNQPCNPYRMHGSQRVNNVVLLQGKGDCVPCMEEGCERNNASLSDCLQNLPVAEVISVLRQLLLERRTG